MKIHHFEDADFRILGALAIDLYVDHLNWKVCRHSDERDNFWGISVRFATSEAELDTNYDAFVFDCGSKNTPETYQMCWLQYNKGEVKMRPITSPLLVVHQFEEMCKKAAIGMN